MHTKFNIGDFVYFLIDKCICYGKIEKMQSNKETMFYLVSVLTKNGWPLNNSNITLPESSLFTTERELTTSKLFHEVISCSPQFHTGDTVWFPINNDIASGIIESQSIGEEITIYRIHLKTINGYATGGVFCQTGEHFYPNRTKLIQHMARESKRRQTEYETSITSIEDLIRFMLIHQISGEDLDIEARQAAINKAKSFGVNLGNIS